MNKRIPGALLFPLDYVTINNYPSYLKWDMGVWYQIHNNLADIVVNIPLVIYFHGWTAARTSIGKVDYSGLTA